MYKKNLPIMRNANVFLIAIDAIDNKELHGRWFNEYLSEEFSFESIVDFLSQVESFFDINGFTQRGSQLRSFISSRVKKQEGLVFNIKDNSPSSHHTMKNGKIVNFKIVVISRVNSTWQGVLLDNNDNVIFKFNSALELLLYVGNNISK